MNLADIIFPLTTAEFLSRYKGQEYFIQAGEPERFQSLFNWEELNHVLYTHRIDYPRFRMIRDGNVINQDVYLDQLTDKRGLKYSRVNSKKVHAELLKGTAIHILSIQEFSENLTNICNNISQALSSDVEMTIHIGMKNSKGFHQHWDSHDVFVLQLFGKKQWQLFDFTEEYPFRIGPSQKQDINLKPKWQGDLAPGDVLYIPRGCWHDVVSYDEPCMHISIGMYNPKGMDYISYMTKQLDQFKIFRKDIPIGVVEEDLEIYLNAIKKDFNELLTTKTLNAYLNRINKAGIKNDFNFPHLKI